ncbi:MAG: PAS domain S-box protein [Anaerolineaceae bacterium]|nr:PAS domain S-box protein [Anaerolineaceae bacterium]
MTIFEIFYLVVSILSAVICTGLAVYLFRRTKAVGSTPFSITYMFITLWILAQLLSLPYVSEAWLMFWTNIRFLPLAFVPYLWFLFALQFYLQSPRLSRKLVVLLALVPSITQVLVWTNPLHYLFINNAQSGYYGSFYIITSWHWGIFFWVHAAYSYTLMLIGMILIIHAAARFLQVYRGQAILLITSAIFPLLITMGHTFNLIPIYLDLTPIAFTVSGIAIILNISSLHFGKLAPIEKEKLIEYMRDGMLMIDQNHEILDINYAALRFLHTSHLQTIGKNLIKLYPFINIPDINEREIYEIEPHIGNEIKRFEVITSPIQRQGQISGWLILLRDITEIALVEMAYKDIERRFNKVIMHSHDGIVIIDDTGKIIIWNQAMENLLTVKRSELIGRNVWDVIPIFTFRHNISSENLHTIEEEIKKGLSSGNSSLFDLPVEISLQSKNKSQRFAEFIVYPIKAGNGYYICFSCHDITDQVEARIILQEANTILENEIKERTADLEDLMNTLEKRIQDRTKDLSVLYFVSASANQNLNLEDMLNNALILILETISASSGTIHIYDEENNILNLIAFQNLDKDFLQLIQKIPAENNIFGDVIQKGNTIINADLSNEKNKTIPYPVTQEQESMSFTGNLMRAKGKNIGVLSVFQPSSKHFPVEQIALLTTISEHLGVVIENHNLQQKAEKVAIIEERQRLARDLHDSVNQRLYSLILYSSAGKKAYHNANEEKVIQHLDKIDQNAQLALREMRILIHELRPDPLESEGFIGAITQRLNFVEKRVGVDYEINIEGELDLSREEESELFSIITEALNNGLKHANASKIIINMVSSEEYFRLEICDNGIGFDIKTASKRNGLGIISMRERAERIGGSFNIQSAYDNFTCVIVEIGQSNFQCDITAMKGKFYD